MKYRFMKPFKATLILLSGATLISFSPVLVKYAYACNLGPTSIGFWRTLIGGLFLLATAKVVYKKISMDKNIHLYALLAGFFFCADLYFWHRSIIYVGAGMSTILGNTQVFGTAVLSFFVFKEKLSVRFIIAALSAFIGVILLVGVGSNDVEFTTNYIYGVLFGLATGIAYANYLVTLKKGQLQKNTPTTMIFIGWTSLYTTFFLGIVGYFSSETFITYDIDGILAIIGLGILVQALGWLAITSTLSHIKTAEAGLILLLQPTLAMVWGVILFSEQLGMLQIIGAVITLAAMYVGSLRKPNGQKKAASIETAS